jgi:hypothetical protein
MVVSSIRMLFVGHRVDGDVAKGRKMSLIVLVS